MNNPQDLPNFPPSFDKKPDPMEMMARHMRDDHNMTLSDIEEALGIGFSDLKKLFDMPHTHTKFDELRKTRK